MKFTTIVGVPMHEWEWKEMAKWQEIDVDTANALDFAKSNVLYNSTI